jgi:hypothetical protein
VDGSEVVEGVEGVAGVGYSLKLLCGVAGTEVLGELVELTDTEVGNGGPDSDTSRLVGISFKLIFGAGVGKAL